MVDQDVEVQLLVSVHSANVFKNPCHNSKLVNWSIDLTIFGSEVNHNFSSQCDKDCLYSDMAVASLGIFLKL